MHWAVPKMSTDPKNAFSIGSFQKRAKKVSTFQYVPNFCLWALCHTHSIASSTCRFVLYYLRNFTWVCTTILQLNTQHTLGHTCTLGYNWMGHGVSSSIVYIIGQWRYIYYSVITRRNTNALIARKRMTKLSITI